MGEYTRRAQPQRHVQLDTLKLILTCAGSGVGKTEPLIWKRVGLEAGLDRSPLMTNCVIILLYVCPRAKLRQIVSGSRSRARRAKESRSIRPSYQMPSAAGLLGRKTFGLAHVVMNGTRSKREGYARHACSGGLRPNASHAAAGRCIQIGMWSDLFIVKLKCSLWKCEQHLKAKLHPAPSVRSATNSVSLPEPKPRAMSERIVVPSVCSQNVASA
jgi:hypothetical protein